MLRVLLAFLLAASIAHPAATQAGQDTSRQFKAGQIVPLKDGTKLKVLTGFAEQRNSLVMIL